MTSFIPAESSSILRIDEGFIKLTLFEPSNNILPTVR
jgi:hypothetical protein